MYKDGTIDTTNLPNSTTDYTKFTVTSRLIKELDYITIGYSSQGSLTWNLKDIQIEQGTVATDFEPFKGLSTHTANFPSTIMGGSYDFVSGEGFETWDYIASYAGETLPGEWMSDRDVYAEGTTPTTGAEVAYIAVTPTPITLTPADVNLLKGSNTVWTDGDNVTVKFQILK